MFNNQAHWLVWLGVIGWITWKTAVFANPIPVPRPTQSGGYTEIFVGQGLDKCEIPALAELQAWMNNSPYRAVNLYIGGANRGCTNIPMTASYLQLVSHQGWKFIPTWVGPQAPCSNYIVKMSADPTVAYQEGVNEATTAVSTAHALGLTWPNQTGTVIYYDLEAYPPDNQPCREAAKAFINGWVAQMHTLGNTAGVYGSACGSNLPDFAFIPNVPDAVWVAHWIAGSYNPDVTVWNLACLSNDLWVDQQRIRQYTWPHTEIWGGVAMKIDSNVLDGPVVDITPIVPEPVPQPLTADFTGDGLVDSAVFDPGSGDWQVAPSCGSRFAPFTTWINGLNGHPLNGDFNGDGLVDSAVIAENGTQMNADERGSGAFWQVALSTGTAFLTPTVWLNETADETIPLVGDFDGDGKEDVAAFTESAGTWRVALSTGTGFLTPTVWLDGQGTGSQKQFAADFNGDGLADTAVFMTNGTQMNADERGLEALWLVALSTGVGFLTPTVWLTETVYSDNQWVGDFNGDGLADTAVLVPNGTRMNTDKHGAEAFWQVAISTGAGFLTPTVWLTGTTGLDNQLVGDFNGDGLADTAVFQQESGFWVALSNGTAFEQPTRWNTPFACGAILRFVYLPMIVR